jgi:hypothetical protein
MENRIEDLKKRVRISLDKRSKEQQNKKMKNPPRYDEIYWEGLKWLI